MLLFSFILQKVLSLDGTNEVGRISKQWSGFLKEAFTDADNFGVTCKLCSVYIVLSL